MLTAQQSLAAEAQRENKYLAQKITQLETENHQKELKYKQLLKRIDDMADNHSSLHNQFQQHQQQVRKKSLHLQQQIDQRNSYISMLESQLQIVEESNSNMSQLLKKSNGKVLQLMKELTQKNKFIKEYIEQKCGIES